MSDVVAVTFAGVVGAVARYAIEVRLERSRPAEPWGVFAVNIVGSALLGVLVGLARADRIGATTLLVAGTGFCGAFTTFSGFSLTVARMARAERPRAFVTATAMVLVCGLSAAAGLALVGVR